MVNDTTRLLGLDGVAVVAVEDVAEGGLVQLANQAVTEVRRRVTIQHRGRRGGKGNREWEPADPRRRRDACPPPRPDGR